VPEW